MKVFFYMKLSLLALALTPLATVAAACSAVCSDDERSYSSPSPEGRKSPASPTAFQEFRTSFMLDQSSKGQYLGVTLEGSSPKTLDLVAQQLKKRLENEAFPLFGQSTSITERMRIALVYAQLETQASLVRQGIEGSKKSFTYYTRCQRPSRNFITDMLWIAVDYTEAFAVRIETSNDDAYGQHNGCLTFGPDISIPLTDLKKKYAYQQALQKAKEAPEHIINLKDTGFCFIS